MMFTLCAVCAFGTESVLKKEISRLGYEILSSENGSVKIKGSITDTYNLNLHLRTATRVLLEVAEFKAESFDELFDGIYAADWQYFLPVNAKFNVEKITTVRSKLFSKSDCQRIIKKACAEKMKKAYKTSTLTESGANYPIFVNLKNNIVSVYLNTSGDGLLAAARAGASALKLNSDELAEATGHRDPLAGARQLLALGPQQVEPGDDLGAGLGRQRLGEVDVGAQLVLDPDAPHARLGQQVRVAR